MLQYQANRLEQLINDILDLSRLEQENGAKKFMPININELLERVKTVHSPRAEGIGLAFTVDLEPDLPLVWGARNQLIQVVTNLVANAINYTPAGSIQVSSSHDTENGRVYIKVSDTGMGIHPDDVPHLFERFYRGKASIAQDIPGTGLGLGIAREIVEAHGGEIDVESKVGIGSTFWVWLPAAEKNETRK
ncbi:MAG: sensor histidine kinase [Anaerolineae bacterium]